MIIVLAVRWSWWKNDISLLQRKFNEAHSDCDKGICIFETQLAFMS